MIRYVEFEKHDDTWKIPDAFYRISIKLVLKNTDNQVLVQKRVTNAGYELPGGGLDWKEDHKTAAQRELKEELGLQLKDLDDEPFAEEISQHRSGYYALKIYYHCVYEGIPADGEPHKTRFEWVDRKAFENLPFQTDEVPILKHVRAIWPDS